MKRIIACILFFVLILLGFFKLAVFSLIRAEEEIWIKVTSPNGGETLRVGETYTITWQSSPNIDKVTIGYKACPSCLDWIANNIPNTGSYNWKVFVGNTTNTKFKIYVIGYWTGHGSNSDTSDSDFTVLGNESPTATPYIRPTTASSSTTNSTTYTYPTYPAEQSITNKPLPTYLPTPIVEKSPSATLTTIVMPSFFYFEGSTTTDLSKIKDPKNVENFTLDTIQGWTFVWTDKIDFTDPKKVKALQKCKDYWVVEYFFFWIKVEWWEVFEKPVEVTYKNENLTGFAPQLKVTELKKEKKTEEVIKLTSTKKGEIKAQLSESAKVEILPKVELLDEKEVKTSNAKYQLSAKTSHQNLSYKLRINGKESEVEPKDFNKESGEFKLIADNLIKGANFVQLFYKEKDKPDFLLAGEKTVFYQPNYLKNVLITVGIILSGIIFIVSGIILEKKLVISKRLSFFYAQRKNKVK